MRKKGILNYPVITLLILAPLFGGNDIWVITT